MFDNMCHLPVKRNIHVLGDSHTRYFRFVNRNRLVPGCSVITCQVPGATAGGLSNANSKTKAATIFENYLERVKKEDDIIFHLGEVDCGMLIWLRSHKNKTSLMEEAHRSIASYTQFLSRCIALGFKNISLSSATLPTITDEDVADGNMANLGRNKIKSSQKSRTLLTNEFNRCVATMAARLGLDYLSVSEKVVDPSTLIVSDFFRSLSKTDHHMHSTPAAIVWGQILRKNYAVYDKPIQRVALKAKLDTFVKPIPAPSSKIPEGYLLPVKKGDVIEFEFLEATEGHVFIANPALNSLPLDDVYRVLYENHWYSYN